VLAALKVQIQASDHLLKVLAEALELGLIKMLPAEALVEVAPLEVRLGLLALVLLGKETMAAADLELMDGLVVVAVKMSRAAQPFKVKAILALEEMGF
jgi:hypothetical protein